MNILVVGKFSPDQFGLHIADTLKDMSHVVYEFDPTYEYKYHSSVYLRRIHQVKSLVVDSFNKINFFQKIRAKRLTGLIENANIDLTIVTNDLLYPEEINVIKRITKSPIALWFPDSIANFNRAFFLISDYDFLFFKDPYIVTILTEQYNKKLVYYLPECCNPKYHKSVSLTHDDVAKYGCDITTYGNPHNLRSSFFYQLLNQNYNIKIWGHHPPVWLKNKEIKSLYTGEYIFNETKAKAVLAAKINLNTLLPSEIFGLNARTFEVAGIGGFQIMQWRPGLNQLFDYGKEIVSFRNFDELIGKIGFYLARPEERDQIARAGSERAFSDHTYSLRINLLLETIFGSKKGYDLPEVKII